MVDEVTGIKSPGYIQSVENAAYYTDMYINKAMDSLLLEGVEVDAETFNDIVMARMNEMFPDETTQLEEIAKAICETYDVPKWRFKMSLNEEIERLAIEYADRIIEAFEDPEWKW